MFAMKRIFTNLLLATAVCALLVPASARAQDRSSSLLLDFGPGAPGQSDVHEIEVLSWSWGVSNPGSAASGGGGGAGKANFQDLSVMKVIDKSTPKLLQACATGKHIAKATLTVRKAGSNQQDYLVIVFEDVLITSVQTGGHNQGAPVESISLNYAKVQVTYRGQGKGGDGQPVDFNWDLSENKGS